jgi:UDP-3-O-[3-hydroxymyristoyl] N-acetylglucosamine deacetylase
MAQQRTLKESIRSTGIGLHTGRKVLMTLRPAPPNTGIVFRRTDLEPPVDIPARAMGSHRDHARHDARRGRCRRLDGRAPDVGARGPRHRQPVRRADGGEVPIMDGSAGPFVFLIQSAGIELQNSPKRFVRVRRPIEVKDGDKWARFEPFEGFRVNFEIEFDTRCSTAIRSGRAWISRRPPSSRK